MGKEEQGIDEKRYSAIPRTLILVFDEDKVLLLKGASTKRLWAGRYNGLGGHVERGENILASAERELQEESGIKGMSLHLCGTIMCDVEEYLGVSIFVFKGEYHPTILKAGEEGSLEWIPLANLQGINLLEDMRVIIPRVYAWSIGDKPFSATNSYNEEGLLVTEFHQ